MKKILLFLCVVLCFTACKKTKDPVVAQVYYHKLYLSEIRENMPVGLSVEDSLAMVNDFIDSWVKEQLVIHDAEHHLSFREKNFDRQLEEYRNHLLVNTYYDKLVSDTSVFKISEAEMNDYVKSFGKQYTVDKEIVKVNYIKLSKGSKLIAPVKAIFFDENRREAEKESLIKILGDSIEYLLDDTWLYLENVQNDIPFEFDPSKSAQKYVEKQVGENHYLLVILDYKSQRSVGETETEQDAARMMLLNQRKKQFIEDYVNKLYEKAMKEGAITQ